MDFINRVTPNQPPSRVAPPPDSVDLPSSRDKAEARHGGKMKPDLFGRWSRIGTNLLLFVVALLVATVAWLIFTSSPNSQASYINTSKLQAIFLNTGQVYFGNIQAMNNQYVVLTNVFYLQTNSSSTTTTTSSANQNVTLVKLGCELHKPYDQMIINNSEVTFWENLQPSGQVAEAVAQFNKAHPNGQTCTQTQAPDTNSSTLQNTTSK
ncbi:MAG: hypothetical protein ACREF5_01880 [Candidatus Saccharimonadales bacterium]